MAVGHTPQNIEKFFIVVEQHLIDIKVSLTYYKNSIFNYRKNVKCAATRLNSTSVDSIEYNINTTILEISFK